MASDPGELSAANSQQAKKARLAQLLRQRADQGNLNQFALSNGQRALWFLHQLAPTSAANNEAFAWRTSVHLDASRLRGVLERIVERHPALRTTFVVRDGTPWAVVHPRSELTLETTSAEGWTGDELQSALAAESNRPFDLERGPLLRMHLFERPGNYVFLTVMHHIAIDLWSMAIIMEEIQALLLAHKFGMAAGLPPAPPSYREFVEWEAQMLRGPEGERQRAYWMERLAAPLPVLELPIDRPRPPVQSFRGKTLPFRLDARFSSRLEDLARTQRTTLNTLLLAAFEVLLHRYSGQDEVLVGTVMSGRTQPRFERVVGYLANPVVMRADFGGDPPFTVFLAQARQRILEALEHQNYPFSLLVERLLAKRDPSRGPLVDAVFVLQRPERSRSRNAQKNGRSITSFGVTEEGAKGAQVALGGDLIELFLVEHDIAKFDLELEMFEIGDELAGWFRYNTSLFDSQTIASLSSNFRTMLDGLVEHPEQRLSELPLLSASESRAVAAASAPAAQPGAPYWPYQPPYCDTLQNGWR
jgi:hypothetical protein